MNNKQLLVNLITNSMDRFSTTHINVAHLSLQANKAFYKLLETDYWSNQDVTNFEFCDAGMWIEHNNKSYKIDNIKDDCGYYMYSFNNPPEHWDESESYWFYKESKEYADLCKKHLTV